MELQARKFDLIQALVNTEDLHLLQKLESVIQSHKPTTEDWWHEISEEEQRAIQEGLAQIEQGKSMTHEEARRIIDAELEV